MRSLNFSAFANSGMRSEVYSVTIPTETDISWTTVTINGTTYYKITLAVSGMKASTYLSNPSYTKTGTDSTDALLETAFTCIKEINGITDALEIICFSKPVTALTISILGFNGA